MAVSSRPFITNTSISRRYTVAVPRCNWQCYPYWQPYQYHYWLFYYGGPLF
jgi:hypothetical protein